MPAYFHAQKPFAESPTRCVFRLLDNTIKRTLLHQKAKARAARSGPSSKTPVMCDISRSNVSNRRQATNAYRGRFCPICRDQLSSHRFSRLLKPAKSLWRKASRPFLPPLRRLFSTTFHLGKFRPLGGSRHPNSYPLYRLFKNSMRIPLFPCQFMDKNLTINKAIDFAITFRDMLIDRLLPITYI